MLSNPHQWLQMTINDYQWVSSVTIFFFLKDSYVLTSIVVGSIFLLSIGIRSALRHSVKKETTFGFLLLTPILLAIPIILGLAVESSHLFDLTVEVPTSCRSNSIFILVWFFCIRLALLVATGNCQRNFGEGMKEAFKNERTVRGYFAQRKAKSLHAFLARASVEKSAEEQI